jgi:hypothetical protein
MELREVEQQEEVADGAACVSAAEAEASLEGHDRPSGAGPGRKSWIRAAAWASGVAVLAGAVTVGLAQFQPLYVINPTLVDAHVAIGGQSLVLPAGAQQKIFVSEGVKQVQVRLSNGVEYAKAIKVSNGFLERFFRTSAFIFDVLGAQALIAADHYYSANPMEQAPPPPVIMAGRDFYALRDVDYVFEGLPESIPSTTRSAPFTRVRTVDRVALAPEALVRNASADPLSFPEVRTRGYAEGQLRGGNRSPALVDAYWAHCVRSECEAAAESFLRELGISWDGSASAE